MIPNSHAYENSKLWVNVQTLVNGGKQEDGGFSTSTFTFALLSFGLPPHWSFQRHLKKKGTWTFKYTNIFHQRKDLEYFSKGTRTKQLRLISSNFRYACSYAGTIPNRSLRDCFQLNSSFCTAIFILPQRDFSVRVVVPKPARLKIDRSEICFHLR